MMLMPGGHFTETLIVKQSKFIAHLVPYGLFDEVLASLKKEHPKARHFVTAYRYLNEFDQIVEGSSDDGEPKGTSGKPTLAVLQGHDLINTAVVTVRYFGGTKLGTGGLVRAYSDATNLVLDSAELLPYVKSLPFDFYVSYPDLGQIEYALQQAGITDIQKEFEAEHVHIKVAAAIEKLETFQADVGRLIRIE